MYSALSWATHHPDFLYPSKHWVMELQLYPTISVGEISKDLETLIGNILVIVKDYLFPTFFVLLNNQRQKKMIY